LTNLSVSRIHAVAVGCTLSDPHVVGRVRDGIQQEGGRALCLDQADVLDATASGRIAALVYDLEPGDAPAVDLVVQVHAARQDWPVWLYYVPRIEVIERLAELAHLRNIWATPQSIGPVQAAEIRAHSRRLLRSVPRIRLLRLLDSILQPLPAEVREFLEVSLARRDHAGPRAFRSRNGAASLPTTLRRLERVCCSATLPGPKRLLDNLMCVFLTFRTFAFDVPLSSAAEQAGLSSKALDDLRHRVLGAASGAAKADPRAQFELAVMALAKACNAPHWAAGELVDQIARDRVA
jgi:hypothetical protein